jgi:hypothetical protein
MENLNFHKQKLYALIIAGVGLISIFLSWATWGPIGVNGLRGMGFVSLIGVGIVAASCFTGDKTKPWDANGKKLALGGFGAMAAGAILFLLINLKGSSGYGSYVSMKAGFGLWLCLLAGLAGLAWTLGLIKIPENKKPPIS